ncbi:hypothetical protein DRE_05089 [Drechslerella stenobrocha 248]|uniref:Extracellular membrane protein CFEM domain-containing protein n=1 Tax=Drechslerella stenobrocha 248 TaxID=1043628 RepID=W7HZU9_9PEZI|nr:hypothetical protein DRE_05089 [Drechslerella stenobrocha 248]
MLFTTVLSIAAVAGVSVAQTTISGPPPPSATSGCLAQNILVGCLNIQNSAFAQCGPVDYVCQCQAQGLVVQCYDQCPNDPAKGSMESKLTALCVAASASLPTSTSARPISSDPVTRTTSTRPASSTGAGEDDNDNSSSSDSDSPSSSGNGRPAATTTGSGSRASGDSASAATKITWMCASSLLAVLTAAFMAL